MKRCIFFLILFLRLYIATAVNYHIQPNGSDSNDGLSFSKAFKQFKSQLTKQKREIAFLFMMDSIKDLIISIKVVAMH